MRSWPALTVALSGTPTALDGDAANTFIRPLESVDDVDPAPALNASWQETWQEALQQCTSVSRLRTELAALCGHFGALSGVDILASEQPGRRQALCFLRMQNSDQEHRLMQALGIGRFGGGLVLVVNFSLSQQSSLTGDQRHH